MAILEPIKGTTVYLWKFIPNLIASVVFIGFYFVVGCLISWRMYKTKTWFSSWFISGCFMEVAGYCARAFCVNMTGAIAPYVIQATLILLPPAFFAATIYMCLSRIIRAVDGDHLSVIKPRIITRVFVLADWLSLMIQGNAAGLTSHSNLRTIATALILVGLAIQLIAFVFFAFCAVIFHRRLLRKPTALSEQIGTKWAQNLCMLYAVSLLIVIRSIFRVVEYAFGEDGYPMAHEWPLFAFDSVLMSLVTIIYFIWYPINLPQKKGNHSVIPLESRASCHSEEHSLRDATWNNGV